jgi:membrane protease YdiL (CAAX protease family)/rubrerythrin
MGFAFGDEEFYCCENAFCMEFADPKFVEVYRARNLPEAHSIRIALEESGIRVRIEGELLQGGVGDLPPGWTTAPRILVEESQIAAARQIIEKAEIQTAARSDDDGQDEAIRCLVCGKIMAESETKCPACGWSYQGEENASQQKTSKEVVIKNGPALAPHSKEKSESVPAPLLTPRQMWWEVLAVLTIAVFPDLNKVFLLFWVSPVRFPYWLESVYLGIENACIIFAVLYLIYRSGEPWTNFGIKRPLLADIPLGGLLYLAAVLLGWFLGSFPARSLRDPGDFYAPPRLATDYLLMVARFSATAFAEELVTRAYLITRLERLLRSRVKAVVLSAAVFGSYHLYYGVWGFVDFMTLGLLYGFLYLWIRRIWPFAIGHLILDGIAVLRIPA